MASITFTAYLLLPELLSQAPALNDHVFHGLNLGRAAGMIAAGRDPTDVWQPWVGQGYPVFHYYQHLPYLLPAVLVQIPGLSAAEVLRDTGVLLFLLFPLSMFVAARRFGLPTVAAGGAALFSTTLSTNALFGFDLASYAWAGHGLYTQLWGMVLLPLALAESHRAITRGGGYVVPALLVAATALSHLAYGYVALLSLVAFALLEPRAGDLLRRLGRLATIVGTVALATAYFWVPLLVDRAYLNRSVWETDAKYDSFGAPTILGWLVRGELFDHQRLPAITALVGVGLAISILRWRDIRYRTAVVLFVMWLLLYFGRPTWGAALDLIPLSRDFFFHRLIGGVHLGGILLAGIGLGVPVAWLLRRAHPVRLVTATIAVVLILVPIYAERAGYRSFNESLMARTETAIAAEQSDLDQLLSALRTLPPGRVYAGLAGQWGAEYRIGDAPLYALLAAGGYDTLRLYHSWSVAGDVAALFDERRLDEYELFNIRYVVAPVDRSFPPFVRPLATFGRHRLSVVETSGYLDLVSTSVAFRGEKSSFFDMAAAWLASDAAAAGEHPAVIFSTAAEVRQLPTLPIAAASEWLSAAAPPRPLAGRVVDQHGSTDAFVAEVILEQPAVVMLKMTYHPGWRATVDGERASTLMVVPGFVGVPVSAGAHTVELRYEAGPLRYWLLGLGVAALVVLAVAQSRRSGLTRSARRVVARSPAP